MKVFKFGGASVKDAQAVKNVAKIIQLFPGESLLIVVSAMGKTTNALEELCNAYYHKHNNSGKIFSEIKDFHFKICHQLFENSQHAFFNELENTFVELQWAVEDESMHRYDQVYDQIVSMGEIISTKIISAYLNHIDINNRWEDARGMVRTDNTYREGKVDFEATEKYANEILNTNFKKTDIVITQGFIGGTSENYTTTLGREGSDYTAAILAYCLQAESVTIWKDVPGVLNADPKWFSNTQKIDTLTYQDAIELAYYGATVIHPKTIKPIQNRNIPLFVKSFIDPKAEGTVISNFNKQLPIPSFIFKVKQILITLYPKDFSFIAEDNLSRIFEKIFSHGVKVHTMQLSAISFSFCTNMDAKKIPDLIRDLQLEYKVLYNENVELVTIRYYDNHTIERVCINKQILLEQKSRYTVQLVVKDLNA
jgi:aspartate kinase